MTIGKFLKRWANAGTKTAPSSAKQDTGWGDNEQVPYEWFNWLLDRVEAKIDKLIEERLASYYMNATSPIDMLTTGLWDDSWAQGMDTANIISSGSTKEFYDLGVYFDLDYNSYLIAFDNSLLKFEIWDPRTLGLVDTSDALTDDLPSGGGETWEAESMCVDGSHIYATFQDTNASPEVYRVQAWEIGTWNVKTGWPSTGTSLPGSGTSFGSPARNSKIVNADVDKLATANTWITVSASSSTAVSIINKSDGTIAGSGAGDCPTGDSAQIFGLVSDGTNIIFSTLGSSNAYLCSTTIADPTVGCGGTNYPRTLATSGVTNHLVNCGPEMIVGSYNDGSGSTAILLRTHSFRNATFSEVERGQNSAATPVVGDKLVLNTPFGLIFDGINIWTLGKINNGSTFSQDVVVRTDLAKLSLASTNQTNQLGDISSVFLICPRFASTIDARSRIVFDGRDLWITMDSDAGAPDRSGVIRRLPIGLLRS